MMAIIKTIQFLKKPNPLSPFLGYIIVCIKLVVYRKKFQMKMTLCEKVIVSFMLDVLCNITFNNILFVHTL